MSLDDNGEGGIWVFDEVELPNDWVFDQLGNRCTIRRGSSPRPAGHPRYFGGGTIPWIKIGDATNTGSRFIERTAEHVNEEGAKCSVLIPAGSLIIANSGVSLGFAAITRVPGCIHDGWLLTTDFRELDRDYLYYCINVATRRLRQLADGTTQPNLNTGIARRLMLPLPPLSEQKAIASILGALDDKIEMNRRMNATLEAMARALFQSWFVDFDPVRAKLDGPQPFPRPPAEGLNERVTDFFALFPDCFEESPLGQVPKGWRVVTLQAIASVGSGKRPVGRNNTRSAECKVPLYGGGGLMGYVPKPLYVNPILFTGRVGTLGLIFRTSEPSWPSDNTLVIEPQDDFFDFTYFVLRGFDLTTLNRGSTQPLLTQTDLLKQQFVLPTAAIIKAYRNLAVPIFQQIARNENNTRTLATLRDTLLPKLLSGELRVANLEKEVFA